MKNTLTFCILSLIILTSYNASAQKQKKESKSKNKSTVVLLTHADSISYIIGHDIGKNLKTNEIEINQEIFNAGIKHGIEGNDSLLSQEETAKKMMQFQQEMMAKRDQKTAQESSVAKSAGEDFLKKNKTAEGVIETSSGLQYKVITEGSGENPSAEDVVEVHYTGKLLDGTVFDSSVERGQPVKFPLNGVIPGWTEGLQLMKPGAKYILYIPSALAYGDRGTGPIPGGATLIFDVELISVEKK
jgi:FKBP-type peptidyl-prolyl cis-trans isomerase FklB